MEELDTGTGTVALATQVRFPYSAESLRYIPQKLGVYLLEQKGTLCVYVGQSTQLRSRIQCWLRKKIPSVETVSILETPDINTSRELERELITRYNPLLNKNGFGEKHYFPKPEPETLEWFSVKEVAIRFSVHYHTVRNWVKIGVLRAYRLNPKGKFMLREGDILRALKQGRQENGKVKKS